MKVLHVIDSGGLYGAEVMLLNLATEQVKQGIEPIIASIGVLHEEEKAIESAAIKRGLRVVKFRMRPGPNLIGALKILKFVKAERVDLLHSHGYKGNILFGFMPKRIRKLPMVATVHGWTWTGGVSRMVLYEWLDSLSLRFVDQVILVDQAMRNHPRISERLIEKLTVVENGIPMTRQPNGLLDRVSLNREIVEFARFGGVICAVGRLSAEKGFDLLLEAVADLIAEGRDLRLIIMGQGEYGAELDRKAATLGLGDRLLMPGYIADAFRYLHHFDLFVMPSLSEGLPIVLLEAMASRVPIVASRVGGIPNVLDNGKAGLLIEPNRVEELKRAISLVCTDMDVARQRAGYAHGRVMSEYTSEKMTSKYMEVYNQVVAP